jgi:hypothetical protein
MADTTTNTTANSNANSNSSNSSNSSSNSSSSSNSNGSSNNSSSIVVDIIDNSEEECCNEGSHVSNPEQFCLSKGDVIVVRIEVGEMSSATFSNVATQTATKFKAMFPSNNILVIPSTTNFSIIKQPEVHV